MARKGIPATPDQLTYERLPGETMKAFQAFRMYRDMGPNRTIENVRVSMGKSKNYSVQLWNWSRHNKWVERSKLYDDWVDSLDRQEKEMSRPRWEALRQHALTENIELVKKLRGRVEEMLDHPLTKERVESRSNGRTDVYILPANWNWSSIATVVKTMAELEAATIAEGMLDEEDESFDPTTATLEECREYINRQRERGKLRPKSE